MLGRAIVLVREDQLSLAIGRRGQNVRLASKLSGWDIEIMTQDELAESIDRAVQGFSALEGLSVELSEKLVEEGYLSYEDLSVIEPDDLMAMGGLTEEEVDKIVTQAEAKAEEAETAALEARRAKREQDRLAAIEAQAQKNQDDNVSEGDEPPADSESAEPKNDAVDASPSENGTPIEPVPTPSDTADAAAAESAERVASEQETTDTNDTETNELEIAQSDNMPEAGDPQEVVPKKAT